MRTQEFSELYGRFLDTSSITRKHLDVRYGPAERNVFDIYYPEEGNGPWPVVVFFHGGAFFKGDKARYQLKPALYGLERGYAVVSVQYRLAPADPLPAAFEDARAAVRHVLDHAAELHIDPLRVGLMGESAGAELACHVGISTELSERVRAIVDWYAPLNLRGQQLSQAASVDGAWRTPDGKTLIEWLFDRTGDDLLRLCDEYNPQNHLHPGIPPVLIEHGSADSVVSVQESLDFHQALLSYLPEGDVPLRIVDGAEHGVAGFEDEGNLDWVFDFLDEHLSKESQGLVGA